MSGQVFMAGAGLASAVLAQRRGACVAAIGLSGTDSKEQVSSLAFDDAGESVSVEPGDETVLAMTPAVAAIVTVQFAVDVPIAFAGSARLTFFLHGASHWLEASDGRITATIADADRLLATPHEAIAASVWRAAAKAMRLPEAPMPPWQVAVEKQATLAAVPSQIGLRAATRTRRPNFTLAGDRTATGLPATIEGAVRSGQQAADVLMNPSMER